MSAGTLFGTLSSCNSQKLPVAVVSPVAPPQLSVYSEFGHCERESTDGCGLEKVGVDWVKFPLADVDVCGSDVISPCGSHAACPEIVRELRSIWPVNVNGGLFLGRSVA